MPVTLRRASWLICFLLSDGVSHIVLIGGWSSSRKAMLSQMPEVYQGREKGKRQRDKGRQVGLTYQYSTWRWMAVVQK